MSDAVTKSCAITKAEIEQLITWLGYGLHNDTANRIDRINYLHKRLKAFDEVEVKPETPPAPPVEQKAAW